jgi:tRNA (guanine-N7-)-methyltransferase
LQTQSRQPTSNQEHLHPRLSATVRRHLETPSRKPVASHNRAAFELLLQELAVRPRRLILDSFCGTGYSTAALARHYPHHLVVGIDKSEHRLAKHPDDMGDNSLLIQADCDDLWRLMVEQEMTVDRHYMLYPNPWPKTKHLQRRVHGGSGFYWLLQLGGLIELRSNWQTYVEEFGVAMYLAEQLGSVARVIPDTPLSLFERKYIGSGHELWAFTGTVTKPPI